MPEADIARSRKESLIIVTGVVLAFVIYPLLTMLLLPHLPLGIERMFYSRLIIWASVGLMFVYARFVEKDSFFLWIEEHYSLTFYLASILCLFGGEFVARIISAIPYIMGHRENFAELKRVNAIVTSNKPLFYFTVITAGVTEELLMRGYILPRISLFFKNPYWPIIISALMFSSLHLGYHSVVETIFTFLFGLICGYYYSRYRNINVLIIFHFLVDYLALYHR